MMTKSRNGDGGVTPWQTIGPYFHYCLPWEGAADLVGDAPIGARAEFFPADKYRMGRPRLKAGVAGVPIMLKGRVLDMDGRPIDDSLVEIWQADAAGLKPAGGEGFSGYGRCATDDDGQFAFNTIMPGPSASQDDAVLAPSIMVSVIVHTPGRLVTRCYFDGDPANDADPVLALVPADRRHTLFARQDGDAWRFDIVVSGEGETVFFTP